MLLQFLSAFTAFISISWAAFLQPVFNFGNNPTKLQMFVHVPDKLEPNPAVIMALHGCLGNAQQMYLSSRLLLFAEKRNYITIYPQNPGETRCWDVTSNKTLKHEGGGDSTGLAQMVKYTVDKYKADMSKVFVTGQSSGGMMTNVLAATYPDIFTAGAVFSGVAPSPCGNWLTCARGRVTMPAQEWISIIAEMFPGYTGKRPRMQLWHAIADPLVQYNNLVEQVKAWSAILESPFRANVTDNPQRGITKMQFGDGTKMVAYSAPGVAMVGSGANVEVMLKWFKLNDLPPKGNAELSINKNGII